jgi:2-polyprenyl-3-methyl-5-hydroxy-6-metoxy-1,4-benzoquinol methylase
MPQSECPLCGHQATTALVRRRQVPVHQNLAYDTPEAARAALRGDLEIQACPACGFVYNQAFDESKMGYGDQYQNEQTLSPTFSDHVDARIQALLATLAPDSRIVEVGCGKGEFLRRLVTAAPAGTTGIGYDTTYVGPDTLLDGRLRFERRYYGPECAGEAVDIVVCRHVIEHVPEPRTLLRAVRQALSQSPGARIFFETPCVQWILEHRVVWDFFYEHCSYFTAASLAWAFEAEGFAVRAVDHVFGGQYLWLEATLADRPAETPPNAGPVPELARQFTEHEARLVADWQVRLDDWSQQGPTALWGAGGKGATLANLVDPEAKRIDCLIDVNPAKAGHYVPGTGHAIVGYEAIPGRGLQRAVLMNPIYRAENQARLDADGIALALVD